uniref:Uncharacterized protein n=1 Tax=Anguilla anguilla TaxID=7936 RepID=A0A0E9SRM5_ANGAN
MDIKQAKQNYTNWPQGLTHMRLFF